MKPYDEFLRSKSQLDGEFGFSPVWMPDCLMDFQRAMVDWACHRGRAALFEDCGLGKTVQELTWAENVVRFTNGRVLLAAPLAVATQIVREAAKFGFDAHLSRDGSLKRSGIHVTNYERLHFFQPSDFVGFVGDESSILKSFDGARRAEITQSTRPDAPSAHDTRRERRALEETIAWQSCPRFACP